MSRSGWLALAGSVVAIVASILVWQTTTTTVSAAPAVDTPSESSAAVSGEHADQSAGPVGSVAVRLEGEELFHAKGCATCHTGPDSTAVIGGFPSLRAASTWAPDRRPGTSAEEYLAESIRAPSAFISPAFDSSVGPTGAMPELGLTEAEIDALVAYLLST